MSLTEIWSRNSFDAECVRVTEENIQDVAEWCDGSITRLMTQYPKKYIRFNVVQYNEHREAKAFIGDWVILVKGEFKHYRDESFHRAYSQKVFPREEIFALIEAIFAQHPHANQQGLSKFYTDKIAKIVEGE